MIGDDNSDCFKGTWNTDFSVKTVTRATGSIASPISACDLVFCAQNNLQNDSSTGVYYSNGKIGVISAVTNNFKPSIDKPIPTLVYYNYRNFSNPSYYYWYQNRSVLTNLSVLNGTYNFTFDFDYLGKHYSIKKRMIISYQFTNSISPSVNSLGTLNKTLKVVLKHVFSKSVANVNTEPVNCGLGCYWEYDVISIKIDLPDEVSNYSKIDSFFKLYGMADNGFKFYLNNSLLKTVESICPSMCHIQSNWSPSNYNFSFPVTSKNNTLLIKAYSDQMIYWAKIYSASVSIETTSKQFTSTVKLSSNSSYATINKDIPVGYFFTNLGDDNSDALRGTWNADRTVKTVTSSTADWSDYLISGADIVFLNSDIHDGLTCLKFSDGRNVNIPQNFEVTIDKMIPFYEYHQGNDDPSFPTHRKDGYYFYLTISPIWFTSFSNANILLSNRNNMNGSYNFTFKFNYNNKDYSFKKTLVISF